MADSYPITGAPTATDRDAAVRSDSLPVVPPWVIIGIGTLLSAVSARFFADGRSKYGVALIMAAIFGPIVFFDLALGLGVWVAVLFIQDLRALSSAPNAIGVLVGLGWLGAVTARARGLGVLRQQRRLILMALLFLIWITLSIAWALKPGPAGSQAGYWALAALALLVTMTTLGSRREITIVAVAILAGAVVASVVGLANGSVFANSNSISQTSIQGRLTGGGGDPNEQAAGFVAAMFLCVGLLSVFRGLFARLGLLLSFIVVSVAFFATESRGGLVALGAASLAALVLFPGHRRRILGRLALLAVVAGIAIAIHPSALSRITSVSGGTSGRNDIWRVAVTLFDHHPIVGVGLAQFQVLEPRYTLRPGTISRVGYIAEKPYPVHNTYLQLLTEVGVIGLIAYLAVVLTCLRSAWLAARLFDRTGQRAMADLTRAVLLASFGFLAAIFFITDGDDWRLWILLGMGPALLALARRGYPPCATARLS